MTHQHTVEIKANLERARQAVAAARVLAAGGYQSLLCCHRSVALRRTVLWQT
jgi:hypothetical protein